MCDDAKDLDVAMKSLFEGNEVADETVMFMDYGQEKPLLFKADRILSVLSYDRKTKFTEGVDYAQKDGNIFLLEGSSIPCITSEVYYGADSTSYLKTEYNGQQVYAYWGGGQAMTKWQVCVTYTHSEAWDGYRQACHADRYEAFINKLRNGEDVTVFFYGDSITYGADSSLIVGYEPYRPSYSMLLVNYLARLHGYTVHYVNTGLTDACRVPEEDFICGTRGTINYVNPAVGGWRSKDGVIKFDTYVKPFLEKYGCDLFVTAFGMNDGGKAPSVTVDNTRLILSSVLSVTRDTSMMIVSTMVPNPTAVNGWYGNQDKQEPPLMSLAEEFCINKTPCTVARMTSVSLSVLKRKEFMDYTGNNINHPNDFFSRVYAQTLFQALYGYENIEK